MTSAAHFGGDPVGPDSDIAWIVEVWNLMGGQIDWNALEPLCELLGIDPTAKLPHPQGVVVRVTPDAKEDDSEPAEGEVRG